MMQDSVLSPDDSGGGSIELHGDQYLLLSFWKMKHDGDCLRLEIGWCLTAWGSIPPSSANLESKPVGVLAQFAKLMARRKRS